MKKFYGYTLLTLAAVTLSSGALFAQEDEEDAKAKGRLSASFETNTMAYFKDDKLGNGLDVRPDDHFASNNYLKLDYVKGKFSAGVQFEAYTPVLKGFSSSLRGADLMFRYAQWTDKNFSVTAGDFYEQFGSGLIFRSWEDRALGFNNSIEGARVTYTLDNILYVTGFWGRPRMYMDRFDMQVRGLDARFFISELAGWDKHTLSVEGSYVSKYQRSAGEVDKPFVDAFSARIGYETGGFFINGEYVTKSDDIYYPVDLVDEPFAIKKGSAQLVEIGYTGSNFGVLGTFRRLEFMENKIDRNILSDVNTLSYLPSLTQQYTYLLTNLHPYAARSNGEVGGQFDVYYNFRKGTALGGKRGTKIHANFSTFYTLNERYDFDPNLTRGELLYRGVGVDIEKWWNRNLKTTILYSMQEYNPTYGLNSSTYTSHIFVGDVTYKFSPKTSIRVEAQYLYSDDNEKDWVAGLVEVNFAPKWSVYVSDMYNHGNDIEGQDKLNYYNVGFSFTHSKTRLQLSYGRNREGYVCSGGVCRLMPAYTGINLAMSIAF